MNEAVTCPHCGSDDVRRNRFSAQALAIGMLLIGFPFIFRSRKYHCFGCGKDFKKKPS